MAAKIVKLARPAEPSISRVLEEFLEEQRARLAPRTLSSYEAVLDLLQSHLNGYAHEGLAKAEAALFRKVVAGKDLKRTAGTVTKKLSKWLAAKGYISEENGREGRERGSEAARDLPTAERAAQILRDAVDRLGIDPADLAEDDCVEFDHFTIARLEPGRLWLDVREGGKRRPRGPIPIPKSATKLLREGWEVSCSLGRVRGAWRIVEVANVYPG